MNQQVTDSKHAGRSIGLSLVGNALAGTAGTAAALYPFNSTPAVVGFIRLALGAISLLILAPFFGAQIKNISGLLKRPSVWIMAASAALYQAFFFAAVERSGVATAALITVGCIPISAGIVGWLALKERLNFVWFISTAIAISGLVVASIGELQTKDSAGILFAVAAGTGIGGYLNAAKVEIRKGAHSMQLPGLAYLIGSTGLFFIVRTDFVKIDWEPQMVLVALFLGVFTMGLANILQIIGLSGIGPGIAATMMLADPVTAALLGILVMGEELTLIGGIGLSLVVIGLLLQGLIPGEPKNKKSVKTFS